MEQNNCGLHILEIEITNTCNLSCKHCYVDKSSVKFMSEEKIKKIIDECKFMGVFRVVFTGGEPLLHKNLISIAKYAKSIGIPETALMTNSLLINEKNVVDLTVFDIIQISIDVPPGEENNFREDYTRKIEEKIKLLVMNKKKVILFATISKKNKQHVPKFVEYARKLNVKIAFNKVVPFSNKELKKECLSPLELKEVLSQIVNLNNLNQIGCSDPLLFLVDEKRMKMFESNNKSGIKGGCTAGIAALYITVDGVVYPCPFVKFPVGNINDRSIEKIWVDNPILNKIRDRSKYEGKCGKCNYTNICGGCRASSLYGSGNLFGSDHNCFKGVE